MTTWTIRLAAAAERDFRDILQWTEEQFGRAQARAYAETITRALEELTAGPEVARARPRREILAGLYSIHIARPGRKGQHVILFRVDRKQNIIEVLRMLHDSMDFARHFPGRPLR